MHANTRTSAVRYAGPASEAEARAKLTEAIRKRQQAKSAEETRQAEEEVRAAEAAFMRAGAQTK